MENISIAKITSAHGIKGFVKIMSFATDPADIVKYANKMFDYNGNSIKIKVVNQIPSANNDVFTCQIIGVEDRNAAEAMRSTELFIKRSDLKKSKKNEFYYIDLVGLDVLDLQKKKIGKIEAVNDFGAGGLIAIKFCDEEYSKYQISDFAFNDETFPEVNIEDGYLIFRMPDIFEIQGVEEN